MNSSEFNCVKILIDMIENHGLVGIKTSFEDEGASFNETIRLKEICNQAKTKITLKIGGPEAIRDLKDSIVIGVKGIVAPMVESAFGLKKFVNAAETHIPKDVLNSVQLNVNLESVSAINSIDEIFSTKEIEKLNGITVGRVDLVSSLNKNREYVNDEKILKMVRKVFIKTKEKNLKCCIGGAVSTDSFSFLKNLHSEGLLDKFETRYIMFDPSIALKNLPKALSKAQEFEYEWLVNKKNYYLSFANQDDKRIEMIQSRFKKSTIDFEKP